MFAVIAAVGVVAVAAAAATKMPCRRYWQLANMKIKKKCTRISSLESRGFWALWELIQTSKQPIPMWRVWKHHVRRTTKTALSNKNTDFRLVGAFIVISPFSLYSFACVTNLAKTVCKISARYQLIFNYFFNTDWVWHFWPCAKCKRTRTVTTDRSSSNSINLSNLWNETSARAYLVPMKTKCNNSACSVFIFSLRISLLLLVFCSSVYIDSPQFLTYIHVFWLELRAERKIVSMRDAFAECLQWHRQPVGQRRTDTFNLNTHSITSRKYFSVSISFRLAFMV